MSVASTPGHTSMKMSPFDDFPPVAKVRSRSVSDRKESSLQKSFIETGAPPDVVQLRKHEISTNTYAQIELEENMNNGNDILDNSKTEPVSRSGELISRDVDGNHFITHVSEMEIDLIHGNDENVGYKPGSFISAVSNDKNANTQNFTNTSKLARPTTIGGLKAQHLPNVSSTDPIHPESRKSNCRNPEANKKSSIGNQNDSNISFEDLLHQETEKHLREEQNEKECSRNDNSDKIQPVVENSSNSRKRANLHKLEDDNANLSDEGIIIGDNNSNANSEASNSPLPPQSSNHEQLHVDEENCFSQKTITGDQQIHKGAIQQEDDNCNQSLIDAKRRKDCSNFNDNNQEYVNLSVQRKQNSTDPSNMNENTNNIRNNNNMNGSNPQMSSPCDDRVPSRIPLSVE